MKILSIDNVREADNYTIKNEPVKSIDLMERASLQLFKWIKKRLKRTTTIVVFAGPGNNGGDGLALARMLHNAKYHVEVKIVKFTDKFSGDFKSNLDLLKKIENFQFEEIEDAKKLSSFNADTVIVDAIFGSGLSRSVEGLAADVIHFINNQSCIRISIDIPSGLFADKHSASGIYSIIRADYTLSFQFPKLAFMFPENDQFVGDWYILNIGLHPDFINEVKTNNYLIIREDIKANFHKRLKFSHKGNYGHALLIAGSYGKMGAAILASKACLRSGLGLLHVHIPKVGYQIMQTTCPEAMLSIDRYDNYFSEVPNLSMYNVIGIGPGLGMEHQSTMALKLLIQNTKVPLVMDADALNILAENKTWMAFLPKNSVLTPHPKEFERIAGKWQNDFEKIELQKQMAIKNGIVIVLKGAYTSVCLPSGDVYFNSTGNPGMATGGSGDVLTGLITGLIASGYSSAKSAIIGTYIHGLAGDFASKKLGQNGMIASDIVDNIPKAMKQFSN